MNLQSQVDWSRSVTLESMIDIQIRDDDLEGYFFSVHVVVSAYTFHDPPAYERKDDAHVSQDNAFQSHSESPIRQLSFILGSCRGLVHNFFWDTAGKMFPGQLK
mmetsp:Transcript_18667/g.27691  ORF Transcript_18667/g.27691 Transcript_18667/m.27691 type:complete len:104 (-) Transcript_18667:97-408(-)